MPGNAPIDKLDLRQSNHPVAVVFHGLFKIAAICIYFFFRIFLSDMIVYLIVIILSAFDF